MEAKRSFFLMGDEGASNHCITENRSIMSQVVFDFFDEAFGSFAQ